MSFRFLIALVGMFGLISCVGAPDPASRTLAGEPVDEVMVLGVYHMANPGRDAFNLEADDVLSDRRQAEIRTLMDRLAAFEPTLIAVEAPYDSDVIAERYAKYRAGAYELTRNEIDQIGFRLAGQLDHQTVYPVDYPLLMDAGLDESARDTVARFQDLYDAGREAGERDKAKSAERLASSTVSGYLAYLNAPENVAKDHEYYARYWMPVGVDDQFVGPHMIANWTRRNLFITHNILRIARNGEKDRILVVFGAGHKALLERYIEDSPYLQPVDPAPYLRDQARNPIKRRGYNGRFRPIIPIQVQERNFSPK